MICQICEEPVKGRVAAHPSCIEEHPEVILQPLVDREFGASKLADSATSVESQYITPPELIDPIIANIFGGVLSLDPCTTPDNPLGALWFFTPTEDGLKQPWVGSIDPRLFCVAPTIYVNPPYGKEIRLWLDRAIDAAQNSAAKIVFLAPARPGSRWFEMALRYASDTLFLRKRVNFVHPVTRMIIESPSKFPSVLFAFNCSLAPLQAYGLRVALKEETQP